MISVSNVVAVLAPGFSVGVGIQHFNELLDVPLSKMARGDGDKKKLFMGLSSLVLAGLSTWLLKLHIVQLLSDTPDNPSIAFRVMDGLVTALIVSTGTEGINSIIKFLGYAKDQQHAVVAQGAAGAVIKEAPMGTVGHG